MNVWLFLKKKIEEGHKTILMVVIDHSGSSPGQAGFMMAVASDGALSGSIGGGQSEFSLAEKARKMLHKNDTVIVLKKEIHSEKAQNESSGMICSGEHWVAFYPLTLNELPMIDQLITAVEKNQKGLISFHQNGITFLENKTEKHSHKNRVTSDTEWELNLPTGIQNEIFIFGAGHVGLALSKLMKTLGFNIHIFDDRQDLNTLQENTFADEKKVVDYQNISELIPEGENVFIVIMTFGHKSDEVVLKQLLNKKVKYLGMMGSSKKVASIYKNLAEEGVNVSTLKKIDAPIGIPIGSQTPAEIAVSIAAKIIEVKNKKTF